MLFVGKMNNREVSTEHCTILEELIGLILYGKSLMFEVLYDFHVCIIMVVYTTKTKWCFR